MGLFSFLFKDHRRSPDYDYEEEEWEKTSLLQPFSSPDPSEDVSDATMMIPQVRKRSIESTQPASEEKAAAPTSAAPSPADEVDEEMDDLMNAISSAVQRKTAKPAHPMAGTQSMLSNVASLVDEHEAQLDEEATAMIPRVHNNTQDDASPVATKEPETIATTDTMGDVTRAVFPSRNEEAPVAEQIDEPLEEETAVLTETAEAEPEPEAVDEQETVTETEQREEPEYTSEAEPEPTIEPVAETETNLEAEPTTESAAEAEPIVEAAVEAIEASEETAETEEMESASVPEEEAALHAESAPETYDAEFTDEEESPAEECVASAPMTFETAPEATEDDMPEEPDVTEEESEDAEERPAEASDTDAAQEEPADETEAAEESPESTFPTDSASLFSSERLTPNPLVSQMLSAVAVNSAPTEPVSTDSTEHSETSTEVSTLTTPAEDMTAEESPSEEATPAAPSTVEDEDTEPEWGANWVSPDAAIPSDSDEYFRLTWKLKGTGKKRRLRAISECVKGQPVYITCGPDDSECVVITEDGEEIGRLTEQDSMVYHTLVSGHPHNMYIKKIRSSQFEKTKVKILVIVHRGLPNAAENGVISDS